MVAVVDVLVSAVMHRCMRVKLENVRHGIGTCPEISCVEEGCPGD